MGDSGISTGQTTTSSNTNKPNRKRSPLGKYLKVLYLMYQNLIRCDNSYLRALIIYIKFYLFQQNVSKKIQDVLKTNTDECPCQVAQDFTVNVLKKQHQL